MLSAKFNTHGVGGVLAIDGTALLYCAGQPMLNLARGDFLEAYAAFAGPGYLIAVGYMDPGNWATDLGGGSRFGYMLLSVIRGSIVLPKGG